MKFSLGLGGTLEGTRFNIIDIAPAVKRSDASRFLTGTEWKTYLPFQLSKVLGEIYIVDFCSLYRFKSERSKVALLI